MNPDGAVERVTGDSIKIVQGASLSASLRLCVLCVNIKIPSPRLRCPPS
jgi:hypothetical protein